MKVFFLALCSILVMGFMASGQEPAPVSSQDIPPEILEHFGFVHEVDVKQLPALDLDFKTLVDLLVDYDVVHESKVMGSMEYWGLTDMNARRVMLSEVPSLSTRREAVLHEFLHAAYDARGVDTSGPYETQIRRKAHEMFLSIYGFKE